MRSTLDRIRHAVSFELVGLVLVTLLGSLLFDLPPVDMGVVGAVSATIAACWAYVYNLGFDHLMKRRTGSTWKTVPVRIVHAILLEAGLLFVLTPFIAIYLGVTLWHALTMDVTFTLFYLAYGFVFNWAYDRLFPLPEWQQEAVRH